MQATQDESKPAQASEATQLACSFCAKKQSEVLMLIAGPTVYICSECVAFCEEIIKEQNSSKKPKVDTPKAKAVRYLKRAIKRRSTLYTLSRLSARPRVLVVIKNQIVDITKELCDISTSYNQDSFNLEELSRLLFNSKTALKRKRL